MNVYLNERVPQDLAWPSALTIDYVTEKIFWADASLDYIAMASMDGSNRHTVVSSHVGSHPLAHTFALTTFADFLFWSDWELMGLYRAHKFSGDSFTKILTLIHRPMDVSVYHRMRQVPRTYMCSGDIVHIMVT
jgi:hypothetical protein